MNSFEEIKVSLVPLEVDLNEQKIKQIKEFIREKLTDSFDCIISQEFSYRFPELTCKFHIQGNQRVFYILKKDGMLKIGDWIE